MIQYKYKRWLTIIVLLPLLFIFLKVGTALTQSSANYTLKKYVFDQGGASSQSTNFTVADAVGQPAPVGEVSSSNHTVSAGFFGGGKFITSIDVAEEGKVTIPEDFKLFQNYPNPFNPETTIQFVIKEPCRVTLNVYNVLGQKIAKLVNQLHQPGKYKVIFDAAGLPSGVYFYQVQMGDFLAVRKMVLLE
ncbi:MAG: T9SS type A sorting domain-containing protein [Bacteroidales bacterium]|nr:T9SS type A sorting domain-containing protein [Bacteroidales bacterium]